MTRSPTTRRRFLQLAAGAGLASRAAFAVARTAAPTPGGTSGAASSAAIADGALRLEFEASMRSRAWYVPPAGRYRVRDCFNERELGEEAAPGASLPLAFEHFLLLKAIPV